MVKFHHDCCKCSYLGSNETHDFYSCDEGGSPLGVTLIARYGDKGWENSSFPVKILESSMREIEANAPESPLLVAYRYFKAMEEKRPQKS